MIKDLPRRCAQVLQSHAGPVYCATFDGSGGYVLSGGADKAVNLSNVTSGDLVQSFKGHSKEVYTIALAPDGNSFVSAGDDRALLLWDVSTGRILRRLQGHFDRINAACYAAPAGGDGAHGSSSVVASASYDGTIRLWDLRSPSSRTAMMVLQDATDSVTSLHFLHGDTCCLLAGSIDEHVRRYDIRAGQLVTDHVQHSVTAVQFTPDGQAYLAACLDSTIRLFDGPTGRILGSFGGHANEKYRIGATFFDNCTHIAGGSEDGSLYIWDTIKGGEVAARLVGHRMAITDVSSHGGSGNTLLTCSLDGTCRIWT